MTTNLNFLKIALDTCGIVAGWKVFDHAAHLGGMIFGIWWFREGSNLVWSSYSHLLLSCLIITLFNYIF